MTLRENMSAGRLLEALAPCLPRGIRAYKAVPVAYSDKTMQAVSERFLVTLDGRQDDLERCFRDFAAAETFLFTRETKKGERTTDVRALVHNMEIPQNSGAAGVTFEGDSTRSPAHCTSPKSPSPCRTGPLKKELFNIWDAIIRIRGSFSATPSRWESTTTRRPAAS